MTSSRLSVLRRFLPGAALLLGLLTTLALWQGGRRAEQDRMRELLQLQADATMERVERRMVGIQQVLRGASGYLSHGALPTRAEWRDYIGSLELPKIYPGIQGLGFAQWIPAGGRAAHEQRVRAEGFPDYQVRAGGPLPADPAGCSAILYLVPMDPRNQRAFGKDMWAESARREAMARAMDTGAIALTGPVTLFQETAADVQMGTLLYAPVYRQGQPLDTVAQRRQALVGWTYYPLRMADLMEATLGAKAGQGDIELYDGTLASAPVELYDSDPANHRGHESPSVVRKFEVAGRVWSLHTRFSPAYLTSLGRRTYWEIGFGGGLASVLLTGLLWSLLRLEHRAAEMAEQRALKLRGTEARFQVLFEKSPFGTAILDLASGRYLAVNSRLCDLFGRSEAELLAVDFQHVTHPEDLAVGMEKIDALRAGTLQNFELEKRYLKKSGEAFRGRVNVVALPEEPGVARRCFSLLEDITEARQATVEVDTARKRLQSLLEGTGDVVAMMDTQHRYILFNTAFQKEFERIFGVALREGDSMLQALVGLPEDLAHALAYWDRALGGEDFTIEQQFGDPKLQRQWYELHFSPVRGADGRVDSAVHVVRNIAGRKELEAQLQDREARYAAIFDLSPDGISVTRLIDGALTQVNRAWEELFGYTCAEALGRRTGDLGLYVQPEDRGGLFERLPDHGPVSNFTLDLRRKDGTTFVAELNGRVMDIGGERSLLCVLRDVTVEKVMTQTLQESERRFRRLADTAPVLIWMAGLDKLCTWFNKVWLDFTGRTLQQEYGNGWVAGVHPEDLPRCFEIYSSSFDARVPFTMEYRLGHHSGKYRWISDRGTPRYADDGTFLGYIGACSDIQEEKDARDALKESEARFRVLAEDSPLPLMLHRDGRFIYLNAAALHLFRAGDESELVGQSVFDRIVPENQVSARERMRKVTEGGGEPVTFEQRFVTLEGAVVDVAVVGRMVSYDGLPAALAFAQDITGRKRLEESELRAKKAESLVLMAGSIAHDFNNLFQALLTSLELAEYKAKQAPEIARPLAAAKDVLRRAVVLSWKMLDFSGRAIARLERVDLAVLVDGWAAELGQQLGGAPRLELDLGSVPKVNADPEQLNKVLSSIFINAREAMDESGLLDGRVRLKLFVDFGEDRPINQTEGVWVVEPPEGPATVCLEIANDGPTPGPEVLSRMFDPFFTTKALGRGLGLASALGLLQAHRAGIHVLSGPGKGLVFRIHFPPAGA